MGKGTKEKSADDEEDQVYSYHELQDAYNDLYRELNRYSKKIIRYKNLNVSLKTENSKLITVKLELEKK